MKKLILQALQEPSNPASDEEAGGEDTDGVQGVDQQQGGGVELQDLEEQAKSSSSGNVAALPLATEDLSEYEKIRATNVKQKEVLLKQLKRDWRGFKESEGFLTGGGQKGAKKLKVVEKETFNTRSRAKKLKGVEKETFNTRSRAKKLTDVEKKAAHHRSVKNVSVEDQRQCSEQNLGTSGTGLDNGYLETNMQGSVSFGKFNINQHAR